MLIDILFFIDILITFNTAIEGEENQLIVNRKIIVMTYVKGTLAIDTLAIFPFYLLTENDEKARSNAFIRFLRMARLSRVFRASKISKIAKHFVSSDQLEKITTLFRNYDGITRLISGIIFVIILAHFTACM
jgi:hypothetical protein